MRHSEKNSSSASKSSVDCNVDRVLSDFAQKFDPLKHPVSTIRSKLANDTATASGSKSGGVDGSYNISDLFPISSYSHDMVLPSLSEKIENAIGEYFTAITVGAILGAAVATGVGLGLVAASNLISSGKYIPNLYRWAFRSQRSREEVSDDDAHSNHGSGGSDPNQETNVSLIGSGENTIVILRGNVRAQHVPLSSIVEQCRECLDQVGVLLSKQSLGWMHVRRLTVYLVTKRCDAKTFRGVLKDYPLSKNNVIVSVLYIQRLEEAHAGVQVEALASTTQ